MLGDFDGDGTLDAITNSNFPAQVFHGNGDGTFSIGYSFAVNRGFLAAGDVDGDGVLDLVIGETYQDEVLVYRGSGDGTFSLLTRQTVGQNLELVLADFNDDGALDVFASSTNDDTVSVLLNNGDGYFAAAITNPSFTDIATATIGDFNGDGVWDAASAAGGSMEVMLGTALQVEGPPSFSLKTQGQARNAISVISTAIDGVLAELGSIGASQSRLGIAATTLQQRVVNLKEARSRIVDVDVAEETARLVRNQILQQAGTAILAQANQSTALALILLEGI